MSNFKIKFFSSIMVAALFAKHAWALPSPDEVKKRLARTAAPALKTLQLTIIGDSISAGALAGTRLGEPSPELIAALVGAVIARDPDAFLNATLNPQFAYPEGDGTWSLRQQLQAQLGMPSSRLALDNESTPGRAMSDVTDARVQRIKSTQKAESEQQILLMLGSNDFCQGKSPDAYRKGAADALRSLHREFPKARIFVAAVPPIDQLKKVGTEPLLGQVTCESVQRLYCDRIYAEDAGAVIQDYNKGLRTLVSELNVKDPRYKFIDMPKNLTLDKSLLAADCFHPGIEGHRKLAATLAAQMVVKD